MEHGLLSRPFIGRLAFHDPAWHSIAGSDLCRVLEIPTYIIAQDLSVATQANQYKLMQCLTVWFALASSRADRWQRICIWVNVQGYVMQALT